jgi:hypothetical protein
MDATRTREQENIHIQNNAHANMQNSLGSWHMSAASKMMERSSKLKRPHWGKPREIVKLAAVH